MSKKVLLIVGVVLATLVGACLLCLAAGALAGEETPSAPSSEQADTRAPSDLSGRYSCFVLDMQLSGGGSFVTWQTAALPPFTLDGDTYESGDGRGSIAVDDHVVAFSDGPYDGWRGFLGNDATGVYVLFDGTEHHRVRTDGARRGDLKCYRRKD